ncbi:MAG: hypothetical protein IIA88_05120 [Bacteroidetes bacterium]|nr:hypothetical protein [Bacteroidota bacterium]
MNIKQNTIEELNNLSDKEIMIIYGIVLNMKDRRIKKKDKESGKFSYLKVREALKNIKGNLSDDIVSNREDRI